ncbi:uncharacterized protein LOC127288372 [Leptopilina boulardi]|uniref:uncharacterized protein LOC127288372 n=1 Tax=Leptopilina boulardi TaxID=63433 RepID=UPI0021F60BDD|nr:uncharacterized protein LOC127288372 [Leptopilina boulardi]
MLKVICLFILLIAVSNAAVREITFNSGNIIQGKFATGVTLTKNSKGQTVIEWKEQFDSDNALTIYLSHIYEKTGIVEVVEVSNLCSNYERGSFADIIKHFLLRKFRGTNKCPLKKGKITIKYPLTNTYEASSEAKNCGPIVSNMHVVRSKKPGSNDAPLLFSAQLRGEISGEGC